MIEINLKIDGKDEIKVDVLNGINFFGIIDKVQIVDNKFVISGTVKKEAN